MMGKCKKVSGTKTEEQKQQKKNWWGPLGTSSANVKRSVEQKLVGTLEDPRYKYKNISGTTTAEQKQRNKNSRTKIGGHPQTLGDGDPKCKCNKVSRTKTAEQKQ